MNLRTPAFIFALVFLSISSVPADNGGFETLALASEPLIRIGLSTNAASVSITTSDSSLVAVSPDEPGKMLATNKVTVSARAYRPPEVENYRIEFQNLPSQNEANDLAKDIREATGETALVSIDIAAATWKIWVGKVKESAIETNELKTKLAEK